MKYQQGWITSTCNSSPCYFKWMALELNALCDRRAMHLNHLLRCVMFTAEKQVIFQIYCKYAAHSWWYNLFSINELGMKWSIVRKYFSAECSVGGIVMFLIKNILNIECVKLMSKLMMCGSKHVKLSLWLDALLADIFFNKSYPEKVARTTEICRSINH